MNYICIMGAYSNGHVTTNQILSTSLFLCSLMERKAWDICEGRPLSARLFFATPGLYILVQVSKFSMSLLPITVVVRQPQIHGPPLDLALQ